MKNDRLRHDKDDIRNLDDVIDAHGGKTTHMTGDIDSFEEDMVIPEDIDVDEALTFPHPKHKHHPEEDIDLMSTPHKEDTADDQDVWQQEEMLPSEYTKDFNEAVSVFPQSDEEDEVVEAQIHDIGHIRREEIEEEQPVEIMPDRFTPEEES